MKVFCDTNVLVAAVLANHPHHQAARPVVERIKAGADEGLMSVHSLAESYAVLTRLPGASQVAPGMAWQLVNENEIKNFTLVTLTGRDYARFLEQASANGIQGGMIYDALLLAAAAKSGADRIYTFNVSHFQNMADASLRQRIVSP